MPATDLFLFFTVLFSNQFTELGMCAATIVPMRLIKELKQTNRSKTHRPAVRRSRLASLTAIGRLLRGFPGPIQGAGFSFQSSSWLGTRPLQTLS